MITIKPQSYGYGAYTDYMLYLYQELSVMPFPRKLKVPNAAWNEYLDLIYSACGQPCCEKDYCIELPRVELRNDNKTVILGFSGGKDSAATAVYFIDNHIACQLYRAKGFNASYPVEQMVAEQFADKTGLKLISHKIAYAGKCEYDSPTSESVVKDQLIMAMMIDYMIANNYHIFSLGCFRSDSLAIANYKLNLSDSDEIIKAFVKAVKATFPALRYITSPFRTTHHAKAYLYHKHMDWVKHTQSCLIPDRHRNKVRETMSSKYNIVIPPNRCLSCWKCCMDAYLLDQWGFETLPADAYQNQVLRILRKSVAEENSSSNPTTDEELLDVYTPREEVERYKLVDNVLHDIDNQEITDLIDTHQYQDKACDTVADFF